ncbi:MAG: glutamate-cysteine ligase family protein [Planctomycetota bacterium]|jgi:gamma-glutamyl:cysteine ligase YbdK (ATP-grasp superfamily)
MNTFEPRTFSTDWEVMIVDRLNRCAKTEICAAFAGVLRAELELPVHEDDDTIEFGMGVNGSLEQFWQRIQRVTDRATELVHEYDLDLFPCGSHPVRELFNASHIHVGSIFDEARAMRLESHMLRYLPAFAALAANSPFSHYRRGQAKSYRVRETANGCTSPCSVRDPYFNQPDWRGDTTPKMYCQPTMEVRILDCASSRRLLAEMGTFVAAFVHRQGRLSGSRPIGREDYRQALTNRWAAARYGMQATFTWEDGYRPVTDVLDEMLDDCADALAQLGATRRDLCLINEMIRKRICQADLGIDIGQRYDNPHLLASAYAKVVRHWEAFDEFLAAAQPLEPAPPPDENVILEAHLGNIGEGTFRSRVHYTMYYPAAMTDEIIDTMVSRGLVRKEVTTTRGTLLHRIS